MKRPNREKIRAVVAALSNESYCHPNPSLPAMKTIALRDDLRRFRRHLKQRRRSWSPLTRRWLLGVIPVVLALTAWWCYTDGTVTRVDRVTVTRSNMLIEYLSPTTGNGRIGGTPGAWLTRYHVSCVTPRGEACQIEVSRLIDYLAYREGQLISAEATFHKPHGVWAWTDWGRCWAWLSLAAVAVGGLLLRRDTLSASQRDAQPPVQRSAPSETPPAPSEQRAPSLPPGRCVLLSKATTGETPPDKIVAPPSNG